MQLMGGCRFLYLVKSKNDPKFKKFAVFSIVFLCQYIYSFIFPEMAVRRATATP